MVNDSVRDVLNPYLQALTTGGDFARFFAPAVRWTTMETGQVIQGRDAVRDFITAVHTVAFDARVEVQDLVTGDGCAVLEAQFVGTHTGDFAGVAATGRQVRLPYCVVYRVSDGAIDELRAYFPVTALRALLADAPAVVGG